MYGIIELGPSALTEVEMYARGLFDESKVNRDESGEFAKKSGPSAKMADEPFALGGAPKHGNGKHESHEKQGSLFDKDLHGAEARDLPGQTNFLGDDDRSGIDKSDSPSRQPEAPTAKASTYKDFIAAGGKDSEWEAHAAKANAEFKQRKRNEFTSKWHSGESLGGNDVVNFLRSAGIETPEGIRKALQHDDTIVSKTGVSGRGMKRPEAAKIHRFVSVNMPAQ